jgi:hypothetical protein
MAIVLNEEVPLRQRIVALERLMLDAWRRGYKAAEKDAPSEKWTEQEILIVAHQSGLI